MAEPFDPYHKWLGIAPKDQPPNHYRLLGLELFEADPDVIDTAANRITAYLQSCNQGAQLPQLHKLIEEVAAARLCLLDAARKAQYDAALQRQTGAVPTPRAQRGERKASPPAAQAPAAAPAPDDSPFALNFAASPAPAPAANAEPAKPAKGRKRQAQARSWKEYLLWTSPALVILLVALIYMKMQRTKPPVIVKQQTQRPLFNTAEDAKAGVEPVTLQSLQGTALDDNSADLQGNWLATQDLRDKYVGRYYQVAKSGDHVARFNVPAGVSGAFEVRMSYVPMRDRATNVKVQVFPAGGKPVTVTVNQRQPPAIDGLFHSLGTFTFQGGQDERIEISAQGADGAVVADAVQFIRAAGKK
jgi:hypothetical protein